MSTGSTTRAISCISRINCSSDRLDNISPHQQQRSPYDTPYSPYATTVCPTTFLRPLGVNNNKPFNFVNAQTPPPVLSLRVSRANGPGYASYSPILSDKIPSFDPSESDELLLLPPAATDSLAPGFIRPLLPCSADGQDDGDEGAGGGGGSDDAVGILGEELFAAGSFGKSGIPG
ncbi:uncharacterized protein [Venturia canescens]|uniref:uncharacterized protein n=1 Tax=Venturia canescens TaxID=32260 RepID=UPI001C9D61F3|nr:uncharacterized protein LOC122418232 [Venturia canescens]XP_043288276.1 uncharacterized protein LOC122418232 [Venturia canescens]XP_043288277.1 uncharacterized protein LOC122418232 [Venturia canescens]